jgi:hypothetical protein
MRKYPLGFPIKCQTIGLNSILEWRCNGVIITTTEIVELGFVLIQDASYIDRRNPLTHLQYDRQLSQMAELHYEIDSKTIN